MLIFQCNLAGKSSVGAAIFKNEVLALKKEGLKISDDVRYLLDKKVTTENKGLIISSLILTMGKINVANSPYINEKFLRIVEKFMNSHLHEIDLVIPAKERDILKKKYKYFIKKVNQKLTSLGYRDKAEILEAQMNKANILYDEGKYDLAIAAYTKILDLETNHFNALISRAITYEKKGSLQDAVTDYQNVINYYPKNGEAYLRLSNIYINMNLFNEAFNYLKVARQKFPDDRDILLSIAQTYLGLKKVNDAMLVYRQILQKYPYFYKGLMGMGMTYTHMKEYDSARSYFKRALDVSPEDESALFYLSVISRENKENKKSLEYLDRIIQKNPHNVHILFTKGTLYYEMVDFEAAKKTFQNILRIKEDHLYSGLYLGSIAKYEKDIPKAKYYFEMMRKIHPDSPLPHIYLGNLFVYQQKLSLAMVHFRKAQRIEPDNIEALVGMAQVYYGQNLPKKALPMLKQVLSLQRTYFPAINLIASVYEKLGNLKKAVEYYMKRSDSYGFERVAGIYERRGMYRKAIFYYKRLLKDKKIPKDWVEEKIYVLKRKLRLEIDVYYANRLPLTEIMTENTGNRSYGGSFNYDINDKLTLSPHYGHSFFKEDDMAPMSDDNFGLKWDYKVDLNSTFSGDLMIHSYNAIWDGDRNPADINLNYKYSHGPMDFRFGYSDKVLEEDIITIYAKLREGTLSSTLGYWITNHFYASLSPAYTFYNDIDHNYKLDYGVGIYYVIPMYPSFSVKYDYFYQTYAQETAENGNSFLYFTPKSYRTHNYSLNYNANFYKHFYYNSSLGFSRYTYLYKNTDYLFHVYKSKNTIGYDFKGIYKLYVSVNATKSGDSDVTTDMYSGMSYHF